MLSPLMIWLAAALFLIFCGALMLLWAESNDPRRENELLRAAGWRAFWIGFFVLFLAWGAVTA